MKHPLPDPFRTALTITAGFLIIYLITSWMWMLYLSVAISVMGVFSTYLATLITRAWMGLAWILGLIIPNIILSLIYYLLLFPIALLARIFGTSDPLFLKNTRTSLFVDVNRKIDTSYFEKPW